MKVDMSVQYSLAMPPAPRVVADRFFALSDVARLHILEMLHRDRCVSELQRLLDIEQSRLSFHLKVLKNAQLVVARRAGRSTYYGINPETLDQMAEFTLSAKPGRRPLTCTLACCHPL